MYGIKSKDLKDFTTTENDMKKGKSKQPPLNFQLQDDEISSAVVLTASHEERKYSRRETTQGKEIMEESEFMDLESQFEDLLRDRQSKTQQNLQDEVFDEDEVMGRKSRSS